jgi:hypothetical protein
LRRGEGLSELPIVTKHGFRSHRPHAGAAPWARRCKSIARGASSPSSRARWLNNIK